MNLRAEDYTAESIAKIKWSVKVDSKYNPGFSLSQKNGTSVKLTAKPLKKAGKTDGTFSVTVTVKDTDSTTDIITFSGTVLDPPVIKTTKLPKAKAGAGKEYNGKLELSSGSEPLTWTISGDLPSGLSISKESKSGKDYYLITGEPETAGTYPLTLIVSNDVGSATRVSNLQVSAIAPKIKAPSNFEKKCIVAVSRDFSIDIRAFEIKGTKPLSIDIDTAGKALGLEYDSEDKIIKGRIETAPSKESNTVKIEVRNPYTESKEGKYKPVTYSLTLIVKSPPSSILPPYNDPYYHASSAYQSAVPPFAQLGKKYKATFTANGGGKDITWDFLIYEHNNTLDYTYSVMQHGGNYAGLTFSDKGKISGTPTYEDVHDYVYENLDGAIEFMAQASNEAGSVLSGPYTIVFGSAPELQKNTQPVTITNGKVCISLDEYFDWDSDSWGWTKYWDLDDLNGGAVTKYWSDITKTTWETTSTLPSGLSLINYNYSEDEKVGTLNPTTTTYYRCYGAISGDLNIRNPKDVKNYKVKIKATNSWGSATGNLVLNVVLPPVIDPEGKLKVTSKANPLNATLGKTYKLKIPTDTKKPYTWRMEYNNETVDSEIGDSGLVWDATKGMITGAKNEIKPGSYDVTVYLSNEISEDKKTMTITVNLVKLEMTNPKYTNVATLPNASVGKNYKFKAKAKGFGNFTWELTAPSFLVIDPDTGAISSSMAEDDIYSGLSGWSDVKWNNNNSATIDQLIITVTDDYGQSVSIKARLTIKGLTKPAASSPENVTALPEIESSDTYPNDDLFITSDDIASNDINTHDVSQELIVIRERDVSNLSAFSLGRVSNDEYVIAAVLPELEVKESGQYEIDAVIDESIETGAELFWFAFPKDKESTSDDEIAEFYDESGEETECVPESHEVTVSAWLTEGITYEPVIAVKRKD